MIDLFKLLTEKGCEDFILTDLEVARKLTDKRLEILRVLKNKDVESITELVDRTGRNWSNVSNDLDLLKEEGFIGFEDVDGKKKTPFLRCESIFVKPIDLEAIE